MPIPVHTQPLPNGTSFPMIFIQGGTFDMGSDDKEAQAREKPIHQVQLDDFYIGQFSVTQAVWKAVMGEDNNPSYFTGDQRPVESVSWDDCQKFLQALNRLAQDSLFPGYAYRLPTEAEWEYAARGGQLSKGYKYAGSNKLDEVGWYRENSDEESKHVGQLQPNELGLYDMSGNVDEWCYDWHGSNYYETCAKKGIVKNPRGPKTGDNRVLRGGFWLYGARYCRSAFRNSNWPDARSHALGFRLVLSPQSGGG